MCGIVGVIGNYLNGFFSQELDAMEHMLVINGFRGVDSTGAVLVELKDKVTFAKRIGNPWDFVLDDSWKTMRTSGLASGRFLFGHGRKATFGDVTEKNAHPFHVLRKDEHDKITKEILLIHNGTLESWNNKDINKFAVDSEYMANEIIDNGIDGLKEIRGAIATVWYDCVAEELNIFRNNERPLFWVEDKTGNIYFNSEPSVFNYLKWRLRVNFVGDVTEFKPQTLYTVKLRPKDNPKNAYWAEKVIDRPTYRGTTMVIHQRGGASNTPDADEEEVMRWRRRNRSQAAAEARIIQDSLNGEPELRQRFRRLMVQLVGGALNFIEWTDLGETQSWGPGGNVQHGQFDPPLPYLVRAERVSHSSPEVKLSFSNGQDTTWYRYVMPSGPWPDVTGFPIDRPFTPLPEMKASDLGEPATDFTTKRQLKEESKKYSPQVTLKPGTINSWHYRTKTGNTSSKALTEDDNAFQFVCFGNDDVGYYYVGQEVVFDLTDVPSKDSHDATVSKHIGNLVPSTPAFPPDSVGVHFYHSSSRFIKDQRLVGRIIGIRPTLITEFNETGKRVILQVVDCKTVMQYADEDLNLLINEPQMIRDFRECTQEYNRARSAHAA